MSRRPQPVHIGDDVVSRDRSPKLYSARKPRDDSAQRAAASEKERLTTLYNKRVRARARSTSSGQQTTRQLNAEPSCGSLKVRGVGKRESWAQILKGSREQSTFSKCDPLRTLHFLVKELECRLKNDIHDTHLHQIVHDMLSALNRVPPEVASTIHLHQKLDQEGPETIKLFQNVETEREIRAFRTLVNRSVQTPRSLLVDDTEVFRKEVEASTAKLEESCKQMEVFCEKIKAEKQELDQKYRIEREAVKALKKHVHELEEAKARKDALIEQLTRERDVLKAAKSHETPAHVKTIIKELTAQKLEAEKDCVTLRHQLAVSDLEKEKYITLLAVRERQCKEIRDETQQLQEIIKKQLLELGNTTDLHPENEHNFTLSTIQSYPSNEPQKKQSMLVSFAELQSGDSSAVDIESKKLETSSDRIPARDVLMKASDGILANISQSNNIPETLKQIFEELKREAYSITANLYDHS